jgi:hypothetical protein
MVSINMFTLTSALQNVFTNPQLNDESNNKPGPSFVNLDRMEDFWQVKKSQRFIFMMFISSIVYDRNSR